MSYFVPSLRLDLNVTTAWALPEGFIDGAHHNAIAPLDLEIGFAPELLPPAAGYARTWPDEHGAPREESDRWQQALVLCCIASECFSAAGTSRATERGLTA